MTLSKDWKDGVLSIIMRGMSKNFSDQVRWLRWALFYDKREVALSIEFSCSVQRRASTLMSSPRVVRNHGFIGSYR